MKKELPDNPQLLATLTPIDIGGVQRLAGHYDEDTVIVLRRISNEYKLYLVPVPASRLAQRAYCSASETSENELLAASLATLSQNEQRKLRRTKKHK